MHKLERDIALWLAALALLLVFSGCAEPPKRAIIYAPANAVIAAPPPSRLMVKVPGQKMRPGNFLHLSVPTKIIVEPIDPNNPPRE